MHKILLKCRNSDHDANKDTFGTHDCIIEIMYKLFAVQLTIIYDNSFIRLNFCIKPNVN